MKTEKYNFYEVYYKHRSRDFFRPIDLTVVEVPEPKSNNNYSVMAMPEEFPYVIITGLGTKKQHFNVLSGGKDRDNKNVCFSLSATFKQVQRKDNKQWQYRCFCQKAYRSPGVLIRKREIEKAERLLSNL